MLKHFFSRNLLVLSVSALSVVAASAANPFLGGWELTIPGGGAGWLGVEEVAGKLNARIMWGGGSVVPTESVIVDGDKLIVIRKHPYETTDASGKKVKGTLTETLAATLDGDKLNFVSLKQKAGGGEDKAQFSGKRTPPMPPAPDLKKVKYGEVTKLLNGKDLKGWRLTDANAVNAWSVKDGLLVNNPVQEDGKPHKNYGNLRTDAEFSDFNLNVEVRVNKGQNSGIYLRGIYEVQVADTHGSSTDSHNMGAVYSRIKPLMSAENPPGEWQTMDITLVDRHVTVVLNGKTIIDNQPVLGCTGGALWSDVSRPGPLYLQGDHTAVEYRKIDLKPVISKK